MSRKFRVDEDRYSVLLSILGVEAGDVAEYVKDEVGDNNSPGYLLRGPKTWRSTIHGDNVLWLHKDLVVEIKEDDAAKPTSLQDEYNECVEAVLIRHDKTKVKRLFDIAESGDQTFTHVTLNDDLWLRIPQPMRVALIASMTYVTLISSMTYVTLKEITKEIV